MIFFPKAVKNTKSAGQSSRLKPAPPKRELNSAAPYKASSQWVGTLGESAADKKTFESSEQLKSAAAVVGAPADIMASLAQRGMDESADIMASLAQRGMDESPTSVLEPTDKRKPDQKPARSLWSLSVFDYGSPPPTKALPRRDSFEELGQDPASPRTPPAVVLSPVAPPFNPLSCYKKQWGTRPSPEQQRATAFRRAVAPLAAELGPRLRKRSLSCPELIPEEGSGED